LTSKGFPSCRVDTLTLTDFFYFGSTTSGLITLDYCCLCCFCWTYSPCCLMGVYY